MSIRSDDNKDEDQDQDEDENMIIDWKWFQNIEHDCDTLTTIEITRNRT